MNRCQAGDRAAFEQLVRRTARLLFARLYLETGDPHKAEDLVQETYFVAWRSIGQVTEPAGFRTWLLSVAHTVAIDAARREGARNAPARAWPATRARRWPQFPIKLRPRTRPPTATSSAAGCSRSCASCRRSTASRSSGYLAGADYETIGRQLGLTNGSLRGLLNRGMAKLRDMMK